MSETSFDVLRDLLARAGEAEDLDYKRRLDLGSRREIVEFAKDVAAMQCRGGHLVVGVDDNGRPTGEVTTELAALFDESVLSQKIARYIPEPVGLLVAHHRVEGQLVVLIQVLPSPAGFCVFKADGTYDPGTGRPVTVFRRGDVFVRHGTRSERWQQVDIDVLFDQRLARERRPSPIFKVVSLAERMVVGRQRHPDTFRWKVEVEVELEVLVSDIAVYVRDVEPVADTRLVRVRTARPEQPVLSPIISHSPITRYGIYLGERYRYGEHVTLGFTEYYARPRSDWNGENVLGHIADKPLERLHLRLELDSSERPTRLFRRRADSNGGVAGKESLPIPLAGKTLAEYLVEPAQRGEQYQIVWVYESAA